MKKVMFILATAAIFVASCNNNKKKEETTTDNDTIVYRVKTITLEPQKISRKIEYTANLIAYEEVNYAPASPGRIEHIAVEVGSRVKKGDLIARMDRTQLIQASEQLQNARSNFERMDTLYKLKSISEQQYEAAKTQYEVIKANVEFLTKNTTLLSPINGIVTGKYYESGELYTGAPSGMVGKAAIVTIMQINPLKAKINVSERFYPLLKKGMKADITVDIFPGKMFKGEIYRIYPTISPESRTFAVELLITNNDEILRPGMFARVALDMGEVTTLIVPAIALIRQEGTNDYYVFVADNNNKAKKVLVTPGARFDDKIEIISDEIKEGTKIIVAGQDKIKNGSSIAIIN